jgi:hypothetical protein
MTRLARDARSADGAPRVEHPVASAHAAEFVHGEALALLRARRPRERASVKVEMRSMANVCCIVCCACDYDLCVCGLWGIFYVTCVRNPTPERTLKSFIACGQLLRRNTRVTTLLRLYVQSPIGRITRPFDLHSSSLAHVVSEILPAPTAHMLGQAMVGASPNSGRTNII